MEYLDKLKTIHEWLAKVAEALGSELRQEMVFVGGATVPLFLTDENVLSEARSTDDIDVTFELLIQADWYNLQQDLHKRGFINPPLQAEDPICRMYLDKVKVDFIPDDSSILGFTNRWYKKGIKTAQPYELNSELTILKLNAPLFIATKLEAYLGRGNNDLLASHDMEDIFLLINGRDELLEELQECDADVQQYIAQEFQKICADKYFEDFLDGNLRNDRGRENLIRRRFVTISRSV